MAHGLIFIHGYPFDHTLWDSVVGGLKEKIKVITPDLPGFAKKSVPRGTPSIDQMAEHVMRICEAEHVDRAVVCGMSMGGYVALSVAERFAEKVIGLGLISTHCWADTDDVRSGRFEMIKKVRAEGPTVAVNAALQKLFAPKNSEREDLKQYPIRSGTEAGVEGICYALEAMALRPDRSHVVKNFNAPLVIIHGSEDKFIPIDRARQMTSLRPDTEFVEVSGAGHALPLEAPETLVSALSALVDRAEKFSFQRREKRPGVVISPTEHGL